MDEQDNSEKVPAVVTRGDETLAVMVSVFVILCLILAALAYSIPIP